MRRALIASATAALLALAAAAPAHGAYGFSDADVALTDQARSATLSAGAHPFFWTTELAFNTRPDAGLGFEVPDEATKDLTISYPPGMIANPTATPRCTSLEFLAQSCPPASQVGMNEVTYSSPDFVQRVAVYNLLPPPGVAAKLGFTVNNVPVTVDAGVNPNPPYNVFARLSNTPNVLPIYRSVVDIWGEPSDPEHNADRPGCVGNCAAGFSETPFVTAPRACEGPLETSFEGRSWESPGAPAFASALTHDDVGGPQGFIECAKLDFDPEISAQATSRAAEAPTGLDFEVSVQDEGLVSSGGRADSDIKKAVVTLPEGMTANPSQAEGLSTCSEAQLAAERPGSEPGEGCPQAAKIGTVEVQTPLLEETLRGEVFIATPFENPFDTLIALYMTIKSPERGVLVKLAGKVEPDPDTGQLISTFDDLPQVPFTHFHFHFREGGRSPLITPPGCDSNPATPERDPYTTVAEFTPWANPGKTHTSTSTFEITEGVNGAACPAGPQPFEPAMSAGTRSNAAGSFSPFDLQLTRRDGDQDLIRFSAKLPPGMIASLAGVGRCPDLAIAIAKAKSGKAEQAAPSCPPGSAIGRVVGGAGVGSQLLYVPGSLYLAGPYQGAPLSVVAIVPALAGPFDVGNVVVRQALRVNPRSAEVLADGFSSDPLPRILAGIPLRVRDIRVHVDRPGFTLNPTSCEPSAVSGSLWGRLGAFASLQSRFQAAGCGSLGFKPRLGLRLKGGTRRGAFPALRGVYRPRPGDANLRRLVLRLPRSAFLEQGHIRTICTRVQYAANACPPGSIYGRARAFTPLLSEPLQGPVYLRSSNNNLPDFVASLRGEIDVEAVARIDSKRGGIRATFTELPDAPITKVIVDMRGGQKGLIVNSTGLCRKKNRANARFAGQNGDRHAIKPVVRATACKKQRRRARGSHKPR